MGLPDTLSELKEAFLLSKAVAGCTHATLAIYKSWIERFTAQASNSLSAADVLTVNKFLESLEGLSPSTRHQAYRSLKTFFRWGQGIGVLAENPLTGQTVRLPKMLPDAPSDDELRAILKVCGSSFEWVRNRALILIRADSGLRRMEALRLLVQDRDPAERCS